MIRITVTSVYVDDQDRALAFYTDVLGFQKTTTGPPGRTGGRTRADPPWLRRVKRSGHRGGRRRRPGGDVDRGRSG